MYALIRKDKNEYYGSTVLVITHMPSQIINVCMMDIRSIMSF